ncbi:MAG TPA: M23 family metallopeptidase [Pyrinomonadaceae bacterium]|nr:M23 family metallopeptidase [Pyrinomonadaceae bacterium]
MPPTLETFPLIPIGDRIHFYDSFESDRIRSGLPHHAIDIGTARGTMVISSITGRVLHQWVAKKDHRTITGCGWSEAGGNIVLILDNAGYVHYFAHMNTAPLVRAGETVAAGRVLGQVGNTGRLAAGSQTHLHYQVWMIGSGRDAESGSGVFTRSFGQSVNPYDELVRTARSLGAQVGGNGGVFIDR